MQYTVTLYDVRGKHNIAWLINADVILSAAHTLSHRDTFIRTVGGVRAET